MHLRQKYFENRRGHGLNQTNIVFKVVQRHYTVIIPFEAYQLAMRNNCSLFVSVLVVLVKRRFIFGI